MDVKTNRTSPVLTDPAAMSKSRLGIHSSLLPYSPSDSGAFPPDLFLAIPRKKTGVLDDLRASSWLDAMQASSPPHKRMTKEPNNDFSSSDTDIAYRTWLLQHPSALACFEQIMKSSKGKRIALFLDYDGTLSPIVDNPDGAVMSNALQFMSL